MKKLFLSIPLLLITLASITSAETYTSELQTAYAYAFTIGITTQGTIDSANMYGSLIRSHMAKMMVNYSREILGITPDSSLACNFSDVANESAELKWYIIQACQMGLMGVGITAFNPDDVVTRAQFGTVLSRALYGDIHNDGDPYYANHLQALKEAEIMNNISIPSASEVRGYVMLMMMRAGGITESTPSPCDTPENQVLCMIDSASCPLECQGNNIITNLEGTLTIASTSVSIWTLSAGIKYLGSLELTATDHDILLNNLSFQKIGSFTKGWIEDDGVKISIMQSPTGNSAIASSFSPHVIIKQWTSKILSVFIEGSEGMTQWVVLQNTPNIESSAITVQWSFPQTLVK